MNRRAFLSMIGLAPVAAAASILPTPSHASISSFDAAAALDELAMPMPDFALGGMISRPFPPMLPTVREQALAIAEEADRLFKGIRDLASQFGRIAQRDQGGQP